MFTQQQPHIESRVMQAVSENTSSDPVSRPRWGSRGEKWEETCHCIYPLAWHRAVWPGCCEGRRGGDIYHRHRPERTQTEKISFRDNRQKKVPRPEATKSVWKKIFFPLYHSTPSFSFSVAFPTHTHTPLRDRKLELPQPFPPPPPILSGRRVREGRKTEARDQRGNLESPTPSPPKIFPHKTLLLLLPLCSRLHP